VRRSMIPMLVAACGLSTPLVAQHAIAGGIAATVGGSWQVEAVDVGYVQAVHAGPLRSASIGGRFGQWVDESQISGGSRGFVAALVLQTRTGLHRLADVGSETNPSAVGLDLSFEGILYGSANNPLSEVGSAWGAFSVLPGVRIGDADHVRYGLVVGPTVFVGPQVEVRPFVSVRIEMPMAHHKRP